METDRLHSADIELLEEELENTNTTNPWSTVFDHWGCRFYRGNSHVLYTVFEDRRRKWEYENITYTPWGWKRICQFCDNTVFYWKQHEVTRKHRNNVLKIFDTYNIPLDVEKLILSFVFVTKRSRLKK